MLLVKGGVFVCLFVRFCFVLVQCLVRIGLYFDHRLWKSLFFFTAKKKSNQKKKALGRTFFLLKAVLVLKSVATERS